MLEVQDREIEGRGYRVEMMPGKKGRKALVRLYKVFGPALSALISDSDLVTPGSANVADADMDNVSMAIATLSTSIKEDDLEYLCKIMGEHTQISLELGSDAWVPMNTLGQDTLFRGRYKEMFKWLAFALEVNYAGFFGGSGSLKKFVASLVAKGKASPDPSNSTEKSTGKSGG